MKYLSSIVANALALSFLPALASGQTCSCAAVPLLGSMQLTTPNSGDWFFATTYEFHDVSELVAGSSSIPDQTGRDRTSEAFVLEASRGIAEKWSVATLSSAVNHDRAVGGAAVSASGLGDAIVMVRYAPQSISLYSDTAVAFGLGSRIPLGEDDASRQGVTLAEDMQPSTGAFGGIIWAYWARAMNDSGRARIYATGSYTQNGENDRSYRFGDETVVSFGGAFQTQTPWGFNLELSYRNAKRDKRNSVDIPNTGGDWLDLSAAVQYHLSETLALGAAAKIPVRRELNDQLQFTTKYAVRVSLSYVFGNRE